MIPHPARRRTICGLTAAAAASATILGLAAPAAAQPAPAPDFGGRAFGSTAHLGTQAHSDETALIPMCTRRVGVTRADRSAAVHLPGVGRIGAVTTHLATASPGNATRVTARTHTGRTSLFGSLHANALSTAARATRRNGHTRLTGATTLFDASLAGTTLPKHPTPNQKMAIPGIGTAVLNAQHRSHRFATPRITVTAMRIVVRRNNSLGLPAGVIVVGHSAAGLHRPTYRPVSGTAYGTQVRAAGDAVRSGRTAPVYLPCGGSAGDTATRNATARSTARNTVREGAVTSQATSTDAADRTVVTTLNAITRINLLGGVVRARSIRTRAHVARSSSHLARSSRGTNVQALRINGTSHPAPTKPNTSMHIPGVGTLWLHRVIRIPGGLRVYAMQLVLGRATHGLAKGTVITVGAAVARVRRR